MSRIVSVIEAFDAVISSRLYGDSDASQPYSFSLR